LAYRELERAANGSPEQIRALGDARLLPRPWEPATCRTPQLRQQLWCWLEEVVEWLIAEYTWEVAYTIPACWPQHPHLVHEIAVLADQRRRAGYALTSDALEEWHRHNLPAFTERMKSRLRNHCEDGHQTWPAKGRYTRYTAETSRQTREDHFAADISALKRDVAAALTDKLPTVATRLEEPARHPRVYGIPERPVASDPVQQPQRTVESVDPAPHRRGRRFPPKEPRSSAWSAPCPPSNTTNGPTDAATSADRSHSPTDRVRVPISRDRTAAERSLILPMNNGDAATRTVVSGRGLGRALPPARRPRRADAREASCPRVRSRSLARAFR
jgi:hypothetical protein